MGWNPEEDKEGWQPEGWQKKITEGSEGGQAGWNPAEDQHGWQPAGWHQDIPGGPSIGVASVSVAITVLAAAPSVGRAVIEAATAAAGAAATQATGEASWHEHADQAGWQPDGWHFEGAGAPAALVGTATATVVASFSATIVDLPPYSADVAVAVSAVARGRRIGRPVPGPTIIDPRLYVERRQDRTPQYRFSSGNRTRDFYSRKR